ncbi:MAG TPA: lipopolysaccharide biosynthesis protein [Anaerolineales bacterium]|nr:lipopolysaccharide biosynthesis protein [Anaerolineales bacterium]
MNELRQIGRATVSGTLWTYATFMASKLLVMAANVILARLLLPEDFGLLALGLIAINYLDALGDFGVGAAYIWRREEPERSADTAFSLSLAAGMTLGALAFAGAPLAGRFFHQPDLVPVMRVLASTLLIASLGNLQAAKMKKQLEFRRRVLPEIARVLVKGGVSIGLALAGWGVWSLVWGQVAGTLATTLLYWQVVSWRPRLSIDPKIAMELLRYGGQLVLLNLAGYLLMNLDYVFIGNRLGAGPLGFYTMAFRIPELVILNVCYVISQALFPAYARLQHDLPALRSGFLIALRYVALLTAPAAAGMFLVAPEFVEVLYTDRWSASVPVMQALSIYTLIYSLSFNAGDIYKATGRLSILNRVALLRLALTVPVLWFAVGWGIWQVALGQVLVIAMIAPLELLLAGRLLQISWKDYLESLKPALIGAASMCLGLLLLRGWLAPAAPWLRLTGMVSGGALLYLGTLGLAQRGVFHQARQLLVAPLRARPALEEV